MAAAYVACLAWMAGIMLDLMNNEFLVLDVRISQA